MGAVSILRIDNISAFILISQYNTYSEQSKLCTYIRRITRDLSVLQNDILYYLNAKLRSYSSLTEVHDSYVNNVMYNTTL